MPKKAGTVCHVGHPLSRHPSGHSYCPTCNRERVAKSRRLKSARNAEDRLAKIKARIPALSGLDLSWAAGVFEGEGTVTLIRSGKHVRHVLCLSNTDREIVEFFWMSWGGGFGSTEKRKKKKHKTAYTWRMNSNLHCCLIVEQLLPFIRTSRVRCKMLLFLEAQKARHPGSKHQEHREIMYSFCERMAVLNKRGT
jgi:hypothetical protein